MAELSKLGLILAKATAYYRMNSGALTTDSKGSYTLTNTNTVGETANGKYGYAANWGNTQANNKRLTVGGQVGILGSGSKSMFCWAKLNTEISSNSYFFLHIILNDNGSNQGAVWQLKYSYNSGTRRIECNIFNNGTNPSILYNVALGTTLWHHIGWVDNAGTISMYLDGQSVGTPISRPALNQNYGAEFNIGNDNNGLYGIAGMIDEVCVFNSALTAAEILTLYKETPSGNSPMFFSGGVTIG